jgi:adenylosuccinate synthase
MQKERTDAFLLAGLGFGDEVKGGTTDYLVRTRGLKTVIRYNGGPQAAHNVVTDEGRHHTFSQFGSGSFVPGVSTYLSRFMLVNPANIHREAQHLKEIGVSHPLERLFVDRDCLVVTPYHRAANRLRETARGKKRHGSCGHGIGETVRDHDKNEEDAIFVCDLSNSPRLRRKLKNLRDRMRASLIEEIRLLKNDSTAQEHLDFLDAPDQIDLAADSYLELAANLQIVDRQFLADAIQDGPILFEGAQGVLLDRQYGFLPHITWTNITFQNAEALLAEAGFMGQAKKIGILRSYTTRHGHGPFVTEDRELTQLLPDPHNGASVWQGGFRAGYLDLVAHRYALEVLGGVDELSLTCLDRLPQLPKLQVCEAYEMEGGVWARLPFSRSSSTEQQTKLTEQLFKARPIYQSLSHQGGVSQYITHVSESLKTPITLFSFGPRFQDKGESLTALCHQVA